MAGGVAGFSACEKPSTVITLRANKAIRAARFIFKNPPQNSWLVVTDYSLRFDQICYLLRSCLISRARHGDALRTASAGIDGGDVGVKCAFQLRREDYVNRATGFRVQSAGRQRTG